jgi:DNA-binding transcriptional ArsR family regulator
MAQRGARGLFADLHAGVELQPGGRLVLDTAYDAALTLHGRGLVLMPSVFAWPSIYVITDAPWQPTLIYPARGVATAWEPRLTPPPHALARVLGRSRASLLNELAEPASISDLAARLSLTAGAVSQHVTALREAGLLVSHRNGRQVLCRRTGLADALLAGEPPSGA